MTEDSVALPVSQEGIYSVRFGTSFKVDGFGFVGRGEVRIRKTRIELTGRKHWPLPARLVFMLGPTAVIALVTSGSSVPVIILFLSLAFAHYLCASEARVEIDLSNVRDVSRNEAVVRFIGRWADVQAQCVMKAGSVEDAEKIEEKLKIKAV